MLHYSIKRWSLDGFGSASITSTSVDEEEEDDNEYYRNQAIEDANMM
jgi:hypothetical protein